MTVGFISSHKALIAGIAAAFFVVSWILLAIITPIVVAALPEDYFSSPEYLAVGGPFAPGLTFPRRCLLFAKNALAWFLILIGPILFQSIFAPFFGLLLADFRAKPRLIRRFASIPWVWRTLNAFRRRRQLPLFKEQDPGPRTQDPGPRTRDPGPRTQDPGPRT